MPHGNLQGNFPWSSFQTFHAEGPRDSGRTVSAVPYHTVFIWYYYYYFDNSRFFIFFTISTPSGTVWRAKAT